MSKSLLINSKTLIVKVGSSLVTNNGEGLDKQAIAAWTTQISALVKQGKQVVLVSSGAVAEGMQRLGWKTRPVEVNELQAAAAVGQMGLVQMYESCFAQHGLHTAQILLTHDDLRDRKRYLNARSTLKTLLDLNVIPIINENDTVVTDEMAEISYSWLHRTRRHLVDFVIKKSSKHQMEKKVAHKKCMELWVRLVS